MRFQSLVVTCLLLAACSGDSPTAPDLSFRTIGHGEFRVTAPTVRVVRDDGAWAEFVRNTGLRAPSYDPADPIPPISFSTEMAVALLLGQRPTTGYQIRIDRLAVRDGQLVVSATEIVPCVGATILTYPLTVIAIARDDRPVVTEWSRQRCQP